MTATKMINNELVTIFFDYTESCHNVYKHFNVMRGEKCTTSAWLKKFLSAELPYIIGANTYFWHPSSSASERRYNERKRLDEVSEFFKDQGFTIK